MEQVVHQFQRSGTRSVRKATQLGMKFSGDMRILHDDLHIQQHKPLADTHLERKCVCWEIISKIENEEIDPEIT